MLKKTKKKFKRISVPDPQTATLSWETAHKILELSRQHNIQIISRDNQDYPKFLSSIKNPPELLHILGNIDALKKDSIAIVGTREATKYGISAAKKLAKIFVKEGYTIVSGLANGIDTAAHKGALENNGLTVAVLAHGLNTIYPPKNQKLADDIVKNNGAIVSEYPWGTNINRAYFIDRDRIQSGLSLAVFLVESNIKGGAMHTAKYCKEQRRALIVLKPEEYLNDSSSTLGNNKLILEKQADIVFDHDDDLDMVIREMNKIKKKLLMAQDKNKNLNSIQITLG